MMTEEDAKTKWCPFVRAVACCDQTWANRPLDGPEDTGLFRDEKTRCIASACMAWRWASNSEEGRKIYGGFCGLAGELP
jgi:hypothetical protein